MAVPGFCTSYDELSEWNTQKTLASAHKDGLLVRRILICLCIFLATRLLLIIGDPLLDFCVVPIYNVGLDSSVPRHSDGGQCAHNLFASHDPLMKLL